MFISFITKKSESIGNCSSCRQTCIIINLKIFFFFLNFNVYILKFKSLYKKYISLCVYIFKKIMRILYINIATAIKVKKNYLKIIVLKEKKCKFFN
jgi:hypothetical protein